LKIFLIKTSIIFFLIYLVFQLTISTTIHNIQSKINFILSKPQQDIFKDKILFEIKKTNEKENILSNEEREILIKFFKKIKKELDFN